MDVERLGAGNLAINSMPDGSRIIRNSANDTVLALNPTAAAAWDSCASHGHAFRSNSESASEQEPAGPSTYSFLIQLFI